MRLLSALTGLTWWAVNIPAERAFRKALRSPREAQEHLLFGYLRRNAATVFGQRHGFPSIRSVSEYQDRVPPATYDDFTPWVERAAGGEPNVLTRDPVRHFALSSGSTQAAKLVPYTATLQREFRRAVAPWMVEWFRRLPDLALGPTYWSISPVARQTRHSSGGIAIGFEEDSAYLGGVWKRLVDGIQAVPPAVRHIQDMEAFRYATVLHLLRCRELRTISVWHPSFLELLLDGMERNWDALLGEIGGSRSKELSRLGPRAYAKIWPRLARVSCWGDGHAAGAMEALRRRLPGITIEPKGLIATEAFVTLPYAERTPVAIRSHFFEFLDEAGRARLAHELEDGREYSVVVTTGGGFYRYRLQDRVRVEGFVEATPSLRFLWKEDHVSDLCGEKLSEGFVASCQDRVFRRHGLIPAFSLMAPDGDGSAYVLHIETTQDPLPGLAAEMDAELQENPHYRYCRDLGQLAPLKIARIAGGGYGRYVEWCKARGLRAGDIKPCALSRHPFRDGLQEAGAPCP